MNKTSPDSPGPTSRLAPARFSERSARPYALDRRTLLRGAGSLAALAASNSLLPAWAKSFADAESLAALSGTNFELDVDHSSVQIDGKRGRAVTVNGTVPAPLLRWREGDTVTLDVRNGLNEDTSIHWHGILLPPTMDGVPGISFPGIKPKTTFRYQFKVRQAGTYWYHSHSNLQEQIGHYGPLIIDPAGPDPVQYDREHVILLSDWAFESPHRIFSKLKKMGDAFNLQQRTVGDFFRKTRKDGLDSALADRLAWGEMRMMPTDIADVTGSVYTYLMNGVGPEDNWTGLFEPGQRVRLRFINGSAMSIFNVRIPGLPMTVVQADGQDVEPVEVDEFQIGTAETFDVVVQPEAARAFTLVAEANDRSGMARGTLAPELGMEAPVPALRERPLLTMKDMGMDHGAMGHGEMDHGEMDHGAMDHGAMDHGAMGHDEMAKDTEKKADTVPAEMDHSDMDHSAMDHRPMGHGAKDRAEVNHAEMDHSDHGVKEPVGKEVEHGATGHDVPSSASATAGTSTNHDHARGPGVANVAEAPTNRLGERPLGLEDVPHRVLVYEDLRSLIENDDLRAPGRELELHMTSNMERYMWSFDGKKFSEVREPIVFHENERLRLTLVNDTMMPHPIHLHGMFFELVNGGGSHNPRKHTIVVKPGEKLSVDITADEVGDWAFHCHLLYHMHAGMFRVVSVRPESESAAGGAENEHHDHQQHGEHHAAAGQRILRHDVVSGSPALRGDR